MTLAALCDSKPIDTRGSSTCPPSLHRLLFEDVGGHCGACGPGIAASAGALLEANPQPTHDDVRHALAGHVCRCISGAAIIEAVLGRADQPYGFAPYTVEEDEAGFLDAALLRASRVADSAVNHNVDPLVAWQQECGTEAQAALNEAATRFGWQSSTVATPTQRIMQGFGIGLAQIADTTGVSIVDLDIDRDTGTVSVRRISSLLSALQAPEGIDALMEAAAMHGVFQALIKTSVAETAFFPRNYPTSVHRPEMVCVASSKSQSAERDGARLRRVVSAATACAIALAVQRGVTKTNLARPFTGLRLTASVDASR